MKRPLVPVACAYAAGLVLANFFQPSLRILFTAAFVFWGLALVWNSRRALLLYPLLVLVGWTNLVTRTAVISPLDLRVTMPGEALATVRGRLLETPTQRVLAFKGKESWQSLAEVELHAMRTNDTWIPVTGRVLTTTPNILEPIYFSGQPVEITGHFSIPDPPLVNGLFDYRSYLERKGIYFQFRAGATNEWQLLPGASQTIPLSDRFLTWSNGRSRGDCRP